MNAQDSERLARIETKLDDALSGQEDHETRLRKLERWVGKAAGALLVVGVVASALVTKILGG